MVFEDICSLLALTFNMPWKIDATVKLDEIANEISAVVKFIFGNCYTEISCPFSCHKQNLSNNDSQTLL